jgi:hypothetical protein
MAPSRDAPPLGFPRQVPLPLLVPDVEAFPVDAEHPDTGDLHLVLDPAWFDRLVADVTRYTRAVTHPHAGGVRFRKGAGREFGEDRSDDMDGVQLRAPGDPAREGMDNVAHQPHLATALDQFPRSVDLCGDGCAQRHAVRDEGRGVDPRTRRNVSQTTLLSRVELQHDGAGSASGAVGPVVGQEESPRQMFCWSYVAVALGLAGRLDRILLAADAPGVRRQHGPCARCGAARSLCGLVR